MITSRVSMALALFGSLLLAGPARADDTAHVDEAVAALPGIVEDLRARTGVPGIAVAVVHKDRLVYSQGFGVRSVRSGAPVTPDTVFQLASLSKPVGSAAVAAAVGKGTLRWHDPVRRHLPDFRLSDAYVTRTATIADMYAHRSGLQGVLGNELELFGFPRSTIITRLQYTPLSPFRTTYSYSNFGLTIGGEAAARAAGTSWPTLAERMLFRPLGMTHTSYRHKDFMAQPNRASLHQQKADGTWITSRRQPDAQAPAGGASSTVLDLARWMRMQLADGTYDGRRVVKAGPLREARSLQIRTSPSADDATLVTGYGLGISVGPDAQGRMRWTHSGAFSAGAATRFVMIPSLDIGIVALTNGWPMGVPEAIGDSFMDIVETGAVTKDWLATYQPLFAPITIPNKTVEGKPRPADPVPAKALRRYTGTYRNDYVGTAVVRTSGGRLVLEVGPRSRPTRLPLQHLTGDDFAFRVINARGNPMPAGFVAGVLFNPAKGTMRIEEVAGPLGLLRRSG